MHLMSSLLLLIVSARLLGQVFQRFNQPAIVGEMLAGVLLGPGVFNLVGTSPALSGVAELATFLVVLSAGLEMSFDEVVASLRGRGIIVAFLGFVLPLVGGLGVGLYFDQDVMRSLFIGLCVAITALPVAVRILQSLNLLGSNIAKYSIATAIFNDVLALFILGVVLNLPEHKSFHAVSISILMISWKLLVLSAVIIGFNHLLEKVIEKGIHVERVVEKTVKLLGNEALFGILIIFVLIFGSVSEGLGFHYVIGAFFGALLIDRKFFLISRYREIERTLGAISGGFLAPVFFAYLGLEFNITSVPSITFVSVILFVSIFTKILAGWLGGRLIGLVNHEALGVGIVLNGRGAMGVVIASIAYDRGFIGQGLFSTLILMGVVTTMITPIMFKKWVIPSLQKST